MIRWTSNGLGAMVFGDQETGAGLSTFTFKLGTGVVSQVDNVSLSVSAVNNNALGLTASSIDTAANAETAVGVINSAIDTLERRPSRHRRSRRNGLSLRMRTYGFPLKTR